MILFAQARASKMRQVYNATFFLRAIFTKIKSESHEKAIKKEQMVIKMFMAAKSSLIKKCYNKFIENKANSIRKRQGIVMNECLRFSNFSIKDTAIERAKNIFYRYLKDNKEKAVLKYKAEHYWKQIIKIRNRWKDKMDLKRKRLKILDALWEQEKENLLKALKKIKNPNKAHQIVKKKLPKIRNDLKEMTLSLYLEKCKKRHSIEFFKWREHFSISAQTLVSKYVEKLKEQVSKENFNIEDIQRDENEILEAETIEKRTESMPAQVKNLKVKPTLSILSLLHPEVDDFDMIGINLNSTILGNKKLNKRKTMMLGNRSSGSRLLDEEISPEELSKKLKPPRLKYVPTVELMREQIIRACYIKDVDKFIKENTEFKLTL